MATPAADKVLGNDDLVHAICTYLNPTDIANVRQCTRTFEEGASPFLFRSLAVSMTTRHYNRLDFVSQSKKFSGGVREIVWICSHHCAGKSNITVDDEQWWMRLFDLALNQLIPLHEGSTLTRFADVGNFGEIINDNNYLRGVVLGIQKLKGLKHVILSSRAHESFTDYERFRLGTRIRSKPRLSRRLTDATFTRASRIADSMILIAALSAIEHSIESFELSSDMNNDESSPLRIACTTTPLVLVHHLNRDLGFKYLTNLRVDFASQNVDGAFLEMFHDVLEQDGLRGLLRSLPKLRFLFLRVDLSCDGWKRSVWFSEIFRDLQLPALRGLSLSDFWIEANDLIDFLKRHAAIDILTLSNINIGDAFSHLLNYDDFRLLNCYVGEYLIWSVDWDSVDDWKQVAYSCRSLPLKGFKLNAPSIGKNWTVLPLGEAEELEEIAMNGRPNDLVLPPYGSLWGEAM